MTDDIRCVLGLYMHQEPQVLNRHVDTLAKATRVLLIAGGQYDSRNRRRNRVLAKTDEHDVIQALAKATRVVDGPAWDIMELPQKSLVFLSGREVIATIGLLTGLVARAEPLWSGDRSLIEPSVLAHWMESALSAGR